MARGCIRTFFTTLGCLTFLLIAALAVWTFRGELGDAYRSVTGREPPGPLVPDSVIGLPSADALRSAERKERQLATGDAGYVRLTGRTDGAFPIAVPEPVGEVRVRPDGVTLYRRVE